MNNGILFHEIGEQVETFLFIKSSTRGVASNGKPFLTLFLQDKSGEIEAKVWDITDEAQEMFSAEKIVKVRGEIQSYRGRKQLKLKKIRLAVEDDNVEVADFIETAPISPDKMMLEINEYLEAIENPNLKRITEHLLNKYDEQFRTFPAATTNHHEFVSGLAFHVVSMLRLAKAIVSLYPSLDKDLLYAGIILHDLGKVTELSGPISTTYTIKGNLLGHISIMVNEIGSAAKELGITGEEVLILQHLVLSHHGKLEWGSPKLPLIKEAEILHYIDNIDAKINMLDRALAVVKPGEHTERIFAMDNRSFYKPTFHN